MEKYNLRNKTDIKMHNVLFAVTSERDYNMKRLLLLEEMPDTKYNEYILAEGYHCSCYDFDETEWDCIKLTREELHKLLKDTKEYETLRKELKNFIEKY